MSLYSLLCLITVTVYISVPSPTMHDPYNYSLAECTGVFIEADKILTAGHCIAHSRGHQWIKTDDNQSYAVSIISKDLLSDLALLQVDKPINHAYATLGKPTNRTESVYTVNSGDGLAKTYNQGVVNTVYRDEDTNTLTIMHNASILPGASGSGLFNKNGELIGINVAMIKSFAVAVDMYEIRRFLNRR